MKHSWWPGVLRPASLESISREAQRPREVVHPWLIASAAFVALHPLYVYCVAGRSHALHGMQTLLWQNEKCSAPQLHCSSNCIRLSLSQWICNVLLTWWSKMESLLRMTLLMEYVSALKVAVCSLVFHLQSCIYIEHYIHMSSTVVYSRLSRVIVRCRDY